MEKNCIIKLIDRLSICNPHERKVLNRLLKDLINIRDGKQDKVHGRDDEAH